MRRGKLAIWSIFLSFLFLSTIIKLLFSLKIMKIKSICFCLRGHKHKSKENEEEDLEKLSPEKPYHKGKNEGRALTAPADDGGGTNITHGSSSTVASNDVAVTAAVVTAAHVSLMSANDGSGDGGGDGGGSM